MSLGARTLTLLALLCLPAASLAGQNTPPAVPSSPSPSDGATAVPLSPTLSWSQDANARNFDVYFGTTSSPPLVGSSNKSATYSPGNLVAGTTYYWKVDAKGTGGTITRGPLWRFTTAGGTQPPPPATTALSRLKLMTWNIQNGYDSAGQEAVDSQVALIADANVDVVGLHEVGVLSGRDLSTIYQTKLEALTGRTWYRVWAPINYPPSPGGNLVLSRIPIVSSSTKDLDSAPNDPSWSGAKRSAARIELDVNGKRVNVFYTHLDTDVNMRRAQLSLLLDWVGTFPTPRLVGGDFNMMPEEGDYATVTRRADDAWHTLVERFQASPGPDKGYTKNVRGIAPYVGQPGRIDYWFHEKGSTVAVPGEIAVLETQRSDHHAVLFWVRVQ